MATFVHKVYLGLGSNQGDRNKQLARAIELIGERVGKVIRQSSIIETEPWGFTSGNKFLNCAIFIETELLPRKVLEVTKQIESEAEKLTVLQEEVNRAQEAYKEVDTLTADVGTLKAEMPDYEKHESLAKSLQALEKGIKDSEEKAKKLSEKLTSEKENIEKLKAEKVTLEGAAEEKLRRETERAEADKKRSALKAIKLRIDGYTEETAALEKTQTACNKAIIVAENFANEYNEMNTAFLREQAGILADELKDGQPCPVCGSLEHPSPAQKSEKAPTKKQVKDAKKRADDAQKSAQNLSAECAKLKGMLDNERESIQKQLKENDVEAELHEATQLLKDAVADLTNTINAADMQIAALQAKIKRREQLEKLIPEKQSAIDELQTSISEAEKELSAKAATKEQQTRQLEELKQGLRFESRQEAEKHLKTLEGKIALLKKNLETAQRKHGDQKQILEQLNGKKAQLEAQLREAKQLDEEKLRGEKTELSGQKFNLNRSRDAVSNRYSANTKTLQNIIGKQAETEQLEKQYKLTKALSDTANGDISGKDRITLEAYIQMTYFDRVIARANTRFMVMSGGQYEMKRRVEADNKRSQSGLDIDVIDHYNGSSRSVSTLSGGESFKASLSLALGLSDEVQSAAGGVRLDTMFVDEGFGTLDDESLKNAINALASLSEGNRLVGIISHIGELKEKIDKQIVIKKDRTEGSRAEIII